MHIDSRDIEAGAVIQADLCIVGAGAAGISIAREWEGKGKKVALLEGGGFELEMGMQELYHGKITGQRYFPLQSSRMHFFGGTTAHWAGFCSTYDPIDFKERPWVKDSGWPFPFEAIEGYYERAMALVDIRPYPFDASFWENKERVFERIPFDKDKIWTKMWQFSPPTRFGQKYRDEIIHARDIFLYTHTNLVEIETGESGREVSKVIVANLAGKRFEVKAKHYVLACGAIQNARMLLASNHQRPNGLGNDFDLVGRYFMEHLELSTAEMVLTSEQPLDMYMIEFMKSEARGELAMSEEIQARHGILNGTVSLSPKTGEEEPAFIDTFPEDPREVLKTWGAAQDGTAGKVIDKESANKKRKKFKAFRLFTRLEQAPNPESRITLSKERDAMGVLRADLHWKLTNQEMHSIRSIYEILGQELGKMQLGRVKLMDWVMESGDDFPDILGGGWHHMGLTKMNDDPKKGVVDRHCRVHGIENLHIAGSSCFPTAGAANPTLTLIALSLRLSDHLRKAV